MLYISKEWTKKTGNKLIGKEEENNKRNKYNNKKKSKIGYPHVWDDLLCSVIGFIVIKCK